MTRNQLAEKRTASPLPITRPSGPFRSFGEQLQAVVKSAGMPNSMADPRLLQVRGPAGSSEQVPGDGGFLVQPEFSQEIVSKIYSTGDFLSRARHYPVTVESANGLKLPAFDEQSRADGSRFGGVRGYWQNEADAVTAATHPKYRQIDLSLKKLYALSYVTSEMLQDIPFLTAALNDAFSSELKFKLEYAALFGSGQGQPQGIMNSPALITVAKEGGQAAATIVSQNVTKMMARMWGPSRARSVWFVHPDAEQQLPLLSVVVGSGGSQLMLFNYTSEPDDQPNTLMGRPVLISEYCAPLGTTGDIILADVSQYLIADKDGINTAVSMHVKFLTDEQTFRLRWRVDGQPMWHTAVTPFSGSNTLSPYVTLADR